MTQHTLFVQTCLHMCLGTFVAAFIRSFVRPFRARHNAHDVHKRACTRTCTDTKSIMARRATYPFIAHADILPCTHWQNAHNTLGSNVMVVYVHGNAGTNAIHLPSRLVSLVVTMHVCLRAIHRHTGTSRMQKRCNLLQSLVHTYDARCTRRLHAKDDM